MIATPPHIAANRLFSADHRAEHLHRVQHADHLYRVDAFLRVTKEPDDARSSVVPLRTRVLSGLRRIFPEITNPSDDVFERRVFPGEEDERGKERGGGVNVKEGEPGQRMTSGGTGRPAGTPSKQQVAELQSRVDTLRCEVAELLASSQKNAGAKPPGGADQVLAADEIRREKHKANFVPALYRAKKLGINSLVPEDDAKANVRGTTGEPREEGKEELQCSPENAVVVRAITTLRHQMTVGPRVTKSISKKPSARSLRRMSQVRADLRRCTHNEVAGERRRLTQLRTRLTALQHDNDSVAVLPVGVGRWNKEAEVVEEDEGVEGHAADDKVPERLSSFAATTDVQDHEDVAVDVKQDEEDVDDDHRKSRVATSAEDQGDVKRLDGEDKKEKAAEMKMSGADVDGGEVADYSAPEVPVRAIPAEQMRSIEEPAAHHAIASGGESGQVAECAAISPQCSSSEQQLQPQQSQTKASRVSFAVGTTSGPCCAAEVPPASRSSLILDVERQVICDAVLAGVYGNASRFFEKQQEQAQRKKLWLAYARVHAALARPVKTAATTARAPGEAGAREPGDIEVAAPASSSSGRTTGSSAFASTATKTPAQAAGRLEPEAAAAAHALEHPEVATDHDRDLFRRCFERVIEFDDDHHDARTPQAESQPLLHLNGRQEPAAARSLGYFDQIWRTGTRREEVVNVKSTSLPKEVSTTKIKPKIALRLLPGSLTLTSLTLTETDSSSSTSSSSREQQAGGPAHAAPSASPSSAVLPIPRSHNTAWRGTVHHTSGWSATVEKQELVEKRGQLRIRVFYNFREVASMHLPTADTTEEQERPLLQHVAVEDHQDHIHSTRHLNPAVFEKQTTLRTLIERRGVRVRVLSRALMTGCDEDREGARKSATFLAELYKVETIGFINRKWATSSQTPSDPAAPMIPILVKTDHLVEARCAALGSSSTAYCVFFVGTPHSFKPEWGRFVYLPFADRLCYDGRPQGECPLQVVAAEDERCSASRYSSMSTSPERGVWGGSFSFRAADFLAFARGSAASLADADDHDPSIETRASRASRQFARHLRMKRVNGMPERGAMPPISLFETCASALQELVAGTGAGAGAKSEASGILLQKSTRDGVTPEQLSARCQSSEHERAFLKALARLATNAADEDGCCGGQQLEGRLLESTLFFSDGLPEAEAKDEGTNHEDEQQEQAAGKHQDLGFLLRTLNQDQFVLALVHLVTRGGEQHTTPANAASLGRAGFPRGHYKYNLVHVEGEGVGVVGVIPGTATSVSRTSAYNQQRAAPAPGAAPSVENADNSEFSDGEVDVAVGMGSVAADGRVGRGHDDEEDDEEDEDSWNRDSYFDDPSLSQTEGAYEEDEQQGVMAQHSSSSEHAGARLRAVLVDLLSNRSGSSANTNTVFPGGSSSSTSEVGTGSAAGGSSAASFLSVAALSLESLIFRLGVLLPEGFPDVFDVCCSAPRELERDDRDEVDGATLGLQIEIVHRFCDVFLRGEGCFATLAAAAQRLLQQKSEQQDLQLALAERRSGGRSTGGNKMNNKAKAAVAINRGTTSAKHLEEAPFRAILGSLFQPEQDETEGLSLPASGSSAYSGDLWPSSASPGASRSSGTPRPLMFCAVGSDSAAAMPIGFRSCSTTFRKRNNKGNKAPEQENPPNYLLDAQKLPLVFEAAVRSRLIMTASSTSETPGAAGSASSAPMVFLQELAKAYCNVGSRGIIDPQHDVDVEGADPEVQPGTHDTSDGDEEIVVLHTCEQELVVRPCAPYSGACTHVRVKVDFLEIKRLGGRGGGSSSTHLRQDETRHSLRLTCTPIAVSPVVTTSPAVDKESPPARHFDVDHLFEVDLSKGGPFVRSTSTSTSTSTSFSRGDRILLGSLNLSSSGVLFVQICEFRTPFPAVKVRIFSRSIREGGMIGEGGGAAEDINSTSCLPGRAGSSSDMRFTVLLDDGARSTRPSSTPCPSDISEVSWKEQQQDAMLRRLEAELTPAVRGRNGNCSEDDPDPHVHPGSAKMVQIGDLRSFQANWLLRASCTHSADDQALLIHLLASGSGGGGGGNNIKRMGPRWGEGRAKMITQTGCTSSSSGRRQLTEQSVPRLRVQSVLNAALDVLFRPEAVELHPENIFCEDERAEHVPEVVILSRADVELRLRYWVHGGGISVLLRLVGTSAFLGQGMRAAENKEHGAEPSEGEQNQLRRFYQFSSSTDALAVVETVPLGCRQGQCHLELYFTVYAETFSLKVFQRGGQGEEDEEQQALLFMGTGTRFGGPVGFFSPAGRGSTRAETTEQCAGTMRILQKALRVAAPLRLKRMEPAARPASPSSFLRRAGWFHESPALKAPAVHLRRGTVESNGGATPPQEAGCRRRVATDVHVEDSCAKSTSRSPDSTGKPKIRIALLPDGYGFSSCAGQQMHGGAATTAETRQAMLMQEIDLVRFRHNILVVHELSEEEEVNSQQSCGGFRSGDLIAVLHEDLLQRWLGVEHSSLVDQATAEDSLLSELARHLVVVPASSPSRRGEQLVQEHQGAQPQLIEIGRATARSAQPQELTVCLRKFRKVDTEAASSSTSGNSTFF